MYRGIKRSGIFDRDYYLRNNLDVARECMNPIEHYVRYGWREGRNPCDSFDTGRYLVKHPQIVQENINPLYHYLINSPAGVSVPLVGWDLRKPENCPVAPDSVPAVDGIQAAQNHMEAVFAAAAEAGGPDPGGQA